MNFNRHSEIEGTHAVLSASKYTWLRDDSEEKIIARFAASYATAIGTSCHVFAKDVIEKNLRLAKTDKKMLLLHLLKDTAKIPYAVIDYIDFDTVFETVRLFANDAIGFRMTPEVPLKYSMFVYGTADAISYNDGILRIHDLKTGRTPASIDQLLIYAADFCLEYGIDPFKLKGVELRLYQNAEALIHNPEPNEIRAVMNQAMFCDTTIGNFIGLEARL